MFWVFRYFDSLALTASCRLEVSCEPGVVDVAEGAYARLEPELESSVATVVCLLAVDWKRKELLAEL
jgi:hypothetical protein